MLKKFLKLIPRSKSRESIYNGYLVNESEFKLSKDYVFYSLSSNKHLVNNLDKIIAYSKNINTKLTNKTLKNLVFDRFIGGENIEDLLTKIQLLCDQGFKLIVNYSAENSTDDVEFYKNFNENYKLLHALPPDNMIAFKLSSFFPLKYIKILNDIDVELNNIFKEISIEKETQDNSIKNDTADPNLPHDQEHIEILEHKENEESNRIVRKSDMIGLISERYNLLEEEATIMVSRVFNMNEEIPKWAWYTMSNAYDIYDPESEYNSVMKKAFPEAFAQIDGQALRNYCHYLQSLVHVAQKRKINIFIDAEQSFYQTNINKTFYSISKYYNKGTATVFNTYQNYLKVCREWVQDDIDYCHVMNIPFAAKMVRGAYMVEELARSEKLQVEYPVFDHKDATDINYNQNVNILIDAYNRDYVDLNLFITTHNNESIRRFGNYVLENKHMKEKIMFGKLLGLGDKEWYDFRSLIIYQYIPYGDMNVLIPYLVRRAQETSMITEKLSENKEDIIDEANTRL